jgi:single-strand DNA-binding protein
MTDINVVTISGRIGRDPELKYLPSGTAVCNFSIASKKEWVNPTGEKKEITTWIDCKCFREQGERIAEKFKKGSAVCLNGELSVESWEKDGQKKSRTVLTVHFCAPVLFPKKDGQKSATTTAAPSGEKSETDSDVPF